METLYKHKWLNVIKSKADYDLMTRNEKINYLPYKQISNNNAKISEDQYSTDIFPSEDYNRSTYVSTLDESSALVDYNSAYDIATTDTSTDFGSGDFGGGD